ncbi:Rhodanese-like domain-containing protein [Zostera marina]|uniref:Rhodanese-like domain-containing protein n=1 Tax=Zostera marina TaxID=29655 RepID=A0A0K9PFR6_ZOSMR|nr:Rhodanese-like domain-containing protein [Zostera marina]
MTTKTSNSSQPDQVQTIEVTAANDLIKSQCRFLDVRTLEEFAKGHIQDAINISYFLFTSKGKEVNPKFMEEVLKTFSKDDCIIVGCASGARSIRASTDLLKYGFKNTKNMKGGYNAWIHHMNRLFPKKIKSDL